MRNETDLTQVDLHLQDIYAEIRYLAHVLEGIASNLKNLANQES